MTKKVTNQPAYSSDIRYDLRTGFPDLAVVPKDDLGTIAQNIIAEGRGLQYAGDMQGIPEAREQVAAFVSRYIDTNIHMDNLMISSGALWGIDATCRALTEPGDVVLVEDPTFFFAIGILKMSNVEVVSVPLTKEGIDLDKLEATLKKYGDRVKLFYAIPSYQNPTGVCYTEDNRKRMVELAQQYNVTILEDSTYHMLYFNDDNPPPLMLKQYDEGGNGEHVVAVGSFSKILMPALRQGWIWASDSKMSIIRSYKSDSAASAFNSAIVADYLKSGKVDTQVKAARELYGSKARAMQTVLNAHLPSWVEYEVPQGGFFVWMTIPEDMSAQEVHKLAVSRDVDFLPGQFCYVDTSKDRYVRVCFAYRDAETIQTGVKILSECLDEIRQKSRVMA